MRIKLLFAAILSSVLVIAIVFSGCRKDPVSSSPPTVNGTWDYDWGGGTRIGTMYVQEANGIVIGYIYYIGTKYDIAGAFDGTASNFSVQFGPSGITDRISATVNNDRNLMNGSLFAGSQYAFTATKR